MSETNTAALKKLLEDIAAIDNDPNIYEPWCGECQGRISAIEGGNVDNPECTCKEPSRIFVGDHSQDGDAWGAAGDLLALLDRAKPLLSDLLGSSLLANLLGVMK